MKQMLLGGFRSREQAEDALDELEKQGYAPEELSVITSHRQSGPDQEMLKSAGGGAAAGGTIGGLAGLVAGVSAYPALAGLVVAGPIGVLLGITGAAATTVGGAATGAAAGGLVGALIGLGVPKDRAENYDKVIDEGGVVLGITSDAGVDAEARRIMEDAGAGPVSVIDMKDS